MAADRAYLFPVQAGRMMNLNSPESFNAGMYAAENPPQGARVRYLLGFNGQPDHIMGEMHPPEEGAEPHTPDPDHFTSRITILDQAGVAVRTVQEPGSGTKGMHEWFWDLRMDPPFEMEEDAGFGGLRGPFVRPGQYTVQLEGGGETVTTAVTVEADPRLEGISQADLMARREAIMALYELLGPAYEASRVMADIQEEMGVIAGVLETREDVSEEAQEAFDQARGELAGINREAGQSFSQILRLMGGIEGCHCRPTDDELYQAEGAPSDLEEVITKVNRAVSFTMPGLYRTLESAGVWRKEFPTVSGPGGD
jgi:hypothetical protein